MSRYESIDFSTEFRESFARKDFGVAVAGVLAGTMIGGAMRRRRSLAVVGPARSFPGRTRLRLRLPGDPRLDALSQAGSVEAVGLGVFGGRAVVPVLTARDANREQPMGAVEEGGG